MNAPMANPTTDAAAAPPIVETPYFSTRGLPPAEE
jgi:hypothetical protein